MALKQLRSPSHDTVANLRRASRLLESVVHPHLAAPGEVIEADNCWNVSMELVFGVDLMGHLRQGVGPAEPVDGAALRRVLAPLAHALATLHVRGVAHNDVKPGNVVVTERGRPVLLDFGSVTPLGELPEADACSLWGTPAYMAPEQATATRSHPSSDWYAFGVVLFEALSGRLPFPGNTASVLLEKRMSQAPPVLDIVPGADRELSRLAMALLERDPELRPDARQVLSVLAPDGDPALQAVRLERPSFPPGAHPFVGRERPLLLLFEQWARSVQGETRVVRLLGLEGVGRGSVVRRFLDLRDQRGEDALVVRVRASGRERRQLSLVAMVWEALDQHLPLELRDPHVPCEAWGAALARQLMTRAQGRPIVLVVENADWLCERSRAVLQAAAPRLRRALILVTGETRRGLMGGCRACDDIMLPVLSHVEAETLAQRLLEGTGADATLASTLAREGRRLPGLMYELARFGQGCEEASLRAGWLRARIEALSGPARRLLAALDNDCQASGVREAVMRSALAAESVLPSMHELLSARLARLLPHDSAVLAASHVDAARLAAA